MASKKPAMKRPSNEAVDAFINRAPDGHQAGINKTGQKKAWKKTKTQVTVTIEENLLKRSDEKMKNFGQTRSGFFSLVLAKALESGFQIEQTGFDHTETGKKIRVTMTINEDLLRRTDALANKYGQTRSKMFTLALKYVLSDDFHINIKAE
jgi:metal-responsive CopG/Arc/MetJ family transcriptional regulator